MPIACSHLGERCWSIYFSVRRHDPTMYRTSAGPLNPILWPQAGDGAGAFYARFGRELPAATSSTGLGSHLPEARGTCPLHSASLAYLAIPCCWEVAAGVSARVVTVCLAACKTRPGGCPNGHDPSPPARLLCLPPGVLLNSSGLTCHLPAVWMPGQHACCAPR